MSIFRRGILLAAFAVVSANANILIFDSFTSANTLSYTSSTPHTYMGMRFDLGNTATPVDIVAADFYMVSTAAVNYADLQLNFEIWDTYNGASTPVFSNSASGVQTFDVGPLNAAASVYYAIPVTLTTPIHVTSLTNVGIGINYKGNTGSGLADTTNLTSLIRYGANGFAVGSSQANGYFRAGSRTDLNFLSTDARTLSQSNQGLALKLYAADSVPEPGTFALAAGALALLVSKLRRR